MKPPNSAEDLMSSLRRIRKPSSRIRWKVCPHCSHKWEPRKRKPNKCPSCKRDLNPEAKVNVPQKQKRRVVPDLLGASRFTPKTIKQLVDMKLYRYMGIPRNLPPLTPQREKQRLANLTLADRYIMSELGQMQFGRVFRFTSRAAIFFRLSKGIKIMAEHGCFQITERGRQKLAEQKRRAEIAALKQAKDPRAEGAVIP